MTNLQLLMAFFVRSSEFAKFCFFPKSFNPQSLKASDLALVLVAGECAPFPFSSRKIMYVGRLCERSQFSAYWYRLRIPRLRTCTRARSHTERKKPPRKNFVIFFVNDGDISEQGHANPCSKHKSLSSIANNRG